MKKHLLLYILFGIVILTIQQSCSLRSHKTAVDKSIDETRSVFIKKTENGFQLYRNGKPFYIRGASGDSHFKELSNIGGNTIRVYDTTDLSNILDEAHRTNLAVIVDFPIPAFNKKYCTYLNEDSNSVLKYKITEFVRKFNRHPALLIWNLGNEVKYPSVRYRRIIYNFFDKSIYKAENSFIETYNELIDIIHQEDPDHPVSTTLIATINLQTNSGIYFNSPKIDLLSYNTFGILENFDSLINAKNHLVGKKPYYISEWGTDGHWECELTPWKTPIEPTSTKKAQQIKERYERITEIKDEACLGSLVFFWGEKHEVTPTWFSFFKTDYKSEIINTLENLWKKSDTYPTPIGLNYMLVDGKGASDTIIFNPSKIKTSEIFFKDCKRDSIRIEWEIYPEVWWHNLYDKSSISLPKIVDSFISYGNNKATFLTPDTEGPFRIYAYIYDQYGYFATTNTPFYILNNK